MTADGNLQSEVSNKKIIIAPSDWMPLAHLHYEVLEVSYPNILEHLNYDRELALNSMLRPEFQSHGVKNVGSLIVDDRLLHYSYDHILRPRQTNFAQLLQEDIFMLWAIKNNILINLPHYIMQHMLKCKDNNMSLLYAMLISRIFNVFSIDLSRETCVHLGWTNYFGKKNCTN